MDIKVEELSMQVKPAKIATSIQPSSPSDWPQALVFGHYNRKKPQVQHKEMAAKMKEESTILSNHEVHRRSFLPSPTWMLYAISGHPSGFGPQLMRLNFTDLMEGMLPLCYGCFLGNILLLWDSLAGPISIKIYT